MKFLIRQEQVPRAIKFEVEADDFDEAVELIESGSPKAVEFPYWDNDGEPQYRYEDITPTLEVENAERL